jgi:hypothetical protein
MLKKIRRLLLPGLLLISGILLVWAYLPLNRQVVNLTISPREMQLPLSSNLNDPALLENRAVRLEWPSSLRIGDEGMILLEFEPLQEDNSLARRSTSISDAYASYNIMAEARFEVAGIRIDPNNPIRESLPPGKPVHFTWKVSAERAGIYTGNVWLSAISTLDGVKPQRCPFCERDRNPFNQFDWYKWTRGASSDGLAHCWHTPSQ